MTALSTNDDNDDQNYKYDGNIRNDEKSWQKHYKYYDFWVKFYYF